MTDHPDQFPTHVSTHPGHPYTLDDALIVRLAAAVAEGNYYTVASKSCGLHEDAIANWLTRAEADIAAGLTVETSRYIALRDAIYLAETKNERELVGVVRHKAVQKQDWIAAMTFLERRHPSRWGRPAPVQPTIVDNRQITINQVEVVLPAGQSGVLPLPQPKQIEGSKANST